MSMEEIVQFHSLASGPQMEQTEAIQPCLRFALFECFNSIYKLSVYGDILGILHNEEMKIPTFSILSLMMPGDSPNVSDEMNIFFVIFSLTKTGSTSLPEAEALPNIKLC